MYEVSSKCVHNAFIRRGNMKVAVIGSRGLSVTDLGRYLPENTTEIVSGGAKGVDTSAREYALSHGIKLTEFLLEYTKYGRSAPLKRNITIIGYSDIVLAFWDGKSSGTKFVIDNCHRLGVEVRVYVMD
jgi:predicted Rossmann fold nucleotide-binding protein DprA/Smf involved in DNA uptake